MKKVLAIMLVLTIAFGVIGCSNLKEILNLLPPLPKCNWYITDLDCLDHCGWPGCEKWAETKLFLSHEELMQDINYRDPQIVFGVFSAIPSDIPKNEVFSGEEDILYCLPVL